LNPVQLTELYSHMPDNTAGVSLEALEKTQHGYWKVFKEFAPPTGAYLEIGPDIGLFTRHCVRAGQFDYYWLFEPNESVYPCLKDILKNSQHRLASSMSDYDIVPDRSISAAVVIHILGHFLDPKEALAKIAEKLTRQAILLVVTHDESSLLARVLRSKWPPF
jgi:hypothetical protein